MIRQLHAGWFIALDPENRGREEKWFDKIRDDARPAPVPGTIQQVFPGYRGVAWYWTAFSLPKGALQGLRAILRFGAVAYASAVWVNGRLVCEHEGGESPFACDVTDAARPGENLLAVRVLLPGRERIDGMVWEEVPKLLPWGGIVGPVELALLPELRTVDVFARPDLKAGRIDLSIAVRNDRGHAARAELRAAAAPAAGGGVVSEARATLAAPPGNSVHELSLPIPAHRLWSLDDPFLYRVTVTLEGVETSVRCGFRELRVQDGWFYLNGERIYLRSAHTATFTPVGFQVPVIKDHIRRDIINAKAAGFNCVRFIASVAWPETLDFCDEIGMLVYEECGAAWLWRDSPFMEERFERSVSGMILRDRNHPSVAIWGMLNETPDGPIFRKTVEFLPKLRALDPTRLVLLSSGRWDGELSIGSVSNPGSGVWETEWGEEGPGAPARPIFASREKRHLLYGHGALVEGAGDVHVYPYVPQAPEVTGLIRTLGEGTKPVFLSEYGAGSQMDAIGELRRFEQYGAPESDEWVTSLRAKAEAFLADWRRLGFDDVYPFPDDFFYESQRLHSRQRTFTFDCVRSNPRLAGYSLTSLIDNGTYGEGLWTLWREWKPGVFDALRDGWSPVRWCMFVDPMHGYSGRTFTVEAVLANDGSLKAGTYPATFRIMGPAGLVWEERATVAVDGSFAAPAIRARVTIDGPPGEYVFAASLDSGGAPSGGRLRFRVAREADLPRLEAAVETWGVAPAAEAWLQAHDVACRPFEPGGAPAEAGLILVGLPAIEPGRHVEAWAALVRRISRGATALFLDPRAFRHGEDGTFWLPLEKKGRVVGFHDWLYHKESVARRHPVFEGLQAPGILDLDYYNQVMPHYVFEELETPAETMAASFAVGHDQYRPLGHHCGLLLAAYPLGQGRIILNTFPLLENLGVHPAADRLLLNLAAYAAAGAESWKGGATVAGGVSTGFEVPAGAEVPPGLLERWSTTPLYTAWKRDWRLSRPIPFEKAIDAIEYGDCKADEWHEPKPMEWPRPVDMVDIRALFGNERGVVWARGEIDVPASMPVEILAGADGPFRIWVGERVAATLGEAKAPAAKDSYAFPVELPAGRHTITVAFDRRNGSERGFYLRFRRPGEAQDGAEHGSRQRSSGQRRSGVQYRPVDLPVVDP